MLKLVAILLVVSSQAYGGTKSTPNETNGPKTHSLADFPPLSPSASSTKPVSSKPTETFPSLQPSNSPAPSGYPHPDDFPPLGHPSDFPPLRPLDHFSPLRHPLPQYPTPRDFVPWGPRHHPSPDTFRNPAFPHDEYRRRHSSPQRNPSGGQGDSKSYTHLILAVQWIGGACPDGYSSNRPCLAESRRNHWTIHGLWPSNEHSSPEFCSNEKFDGRKLESIKSSLNQFWPSFTSTQDRYFTFWRHEWQKHGTCATDIPQLSGLVNFFTNTLALFRKYDVKAFLENSNITPSKQKTYRPSEIVKAISDDYPTKFDLVCDQTNAKQSTLSEVRFCFNKNLEPTNCRGRNIRCGSEVVYLP